VAVASASAADASLDFFGAPPPVPHPSLSRARLWHPQHQLKLLLIGDSSVGKSSILLRFTDDTFSEKHAATIGVDFKTRDMNFRGKRIRTTVWDTAGQEKFRSLTSSYYRGTHGIVLVYDVTSRESFVHVTDWLNEVQTFCGDDECVLLLVGNKIDLEARAVTTQEGQAFAREKNMVFIETSAKVRVEQGGWGHGSFVDSRSLL
jgi:Ras-related protein Rab-18